MLIMCGTGMMEVTWDLKHLLGLSQYHSESKFPELVSHCVS